MLQKLKLKLVVINVVLLTVVLIAVFVSVYFLLESQLKDQESMLLNKVVAAEIVKPLDSLNTVDFPDPEDEPENDDGNINSADDDYYIHDTWNEIEFLLEDEDYLLPSSSSARMFHVKLYSDDETVTVSSATVLQTKMNKKITKEDIVSLLTTVDEMDRTAGEVDFGNIKLSFLTDESPDVRIYVFIERETREETMSAYIYTASIALFGSIVCVLLVSVYMAGRAIKPVKESVERQEKFIADASHELRTPIAIIRSNTELIMDSPEQTVGDNIKWLEYIHKAAVQMTRMTESLLLLSRSDAKSEVLKEDLNLSVLVEDVYESFKPLFEEKKLTAGGADIEKDIYIYANELGMRQLATIFLDNAVKYTKEGGGISVKLTKDKNYAYLTVSDTGIGMPKEMTEKIFERFFRIDKARSKATGGFGLGLSIAKSISDEHGGEITVESEEGKGSEFCIRLPAAENFEEAK